MQKIQKVLKAIQINSKINLFGPIYQQFLIETLKLTSSCPYSNYLPSQSWDVRAEHFVSIAEVIIFNGAIFNNVVT